MIALLPLLVLGLASTARAQDGGGADPLEDFDYAAWRASESEAAEDGEELATARLIRGSQDARATCNVLVDDINSLAAQWELVRTGAMDRETLGIELAEARERWEDNTAGCRVARRSLGRSSITALTLIWEVDQMERVWAPLVGLCQAWLDDKPRPELDAAALSFRAQLTNYGSWLQSHAVFWDGAWLESERTNSCVDQIRRTSQDLAGAIRSQMVLPPPEREEKALRDLTATRVGIESSLRNCAGEASLSEIQQVELRVLKDQVQAYGGAIEGLLSGDSGRIQRAMDKEQELTGHIVRCRQEHATGSDAVTPSCKPAQP
ncbi:MAG: hypothetical protein KDA24_08725 [Deltaproteobacteria bacterium]|nr:hypothetical protein [Deltaproteobacteria bacterium]